MSDPKREVNELLSKLMGTKVDFEQMMMDAAVKRFRNSWSEQDVTERRRRMHYVLLMAAELAEIRKTTIQATGWCEHAIEAVICGDIEDIHMWGIDGLSFKDESDEYRARYESIFARFRTIAEEALISGRGAINSREAGPRSPS